MIIAIKAPIGGQFRMYDRSYTRADSNDDYVYCERCGESIHQRHAIYGYGEHSDEPYCKDCYNWFEGECDRTGQANIFFRP